MQSSNYGLRIDVPKTYDDYNETSYGAGNDQNDQIPDEYKNDPDLYWAIQASL